MRTESPHPLYVVPTSFWGTLPESCRKECLTLQATESLVWVYTVPPEAYSWALGEPEWGEPLYLEDFEHHYTPTPEEICRGLQGPPGPSGPMGPQGLPADPPPAPREIPEEGTDEFRLVTLEGTVRTIARTVSGMMKSMSQHGMTTHPNESEED